MVVRNNLNDVAKSDLNIESTNSSVTRRASARIQKLKSAANEIVAAQRVNRLEEKEDGENSKRRRVSRKKSDVQIVGKVFQKDVMEEKPLDAVTLNGVLNGGKSVELERAGLSGNGESGIVEETVGNVIVRSDFHKVKETLRLFNKHYLHFVQEEEKRCRKVEIDKKEAKGKKSKKSDLAEEGVKKKAKRPDLKAITKMIETNKILFPKKTIGNFPGIDVGHRFYSRAEMVVVGFHSHWLNGIDYMGQAYKSDYSDHIFPIAVAIVLSGMYEDDLDNADDVIYTGQGGHNLTGNKRQINDQKMERGNLALKNSLEQCVPVRVVRGHESSSSYSGKLYTYDGLYKVVNYWAEKGISGFTVFKYRLRRLDDQPILTTNQVHFTFGRVPKTISEIRGLVCEDIAQGQENIPVPATNLVDDPPEAPTGFMYSKSVQIAPTVKVPTNATGCSCKGSCLDAKKCECSIRNGGDFPYVHRDGGRLVEAKDVVFECGPKCGCGPDCINRTSQRGLKYRLEVFKTPKKGWAVRSWDFIPSGAPICEYTGILMRTDDVENFSDSNYIFDIDCLQTMTGVGGRLKRSKDGSLTTINQLDGPDDHENPEFCIDAGSTGNIARFINHSCEPNLFVQCILSTHMDMGLARVMLFAADNIPPLQELTYDYGYALDSVTLPDGKIKNMACYCGAADCRKRLL